MLAVVRVSTTSFYGAASPLGKKGSHWIPKGLFALKGSGVDRLRGRTLSQVEPAGDGALRRALSGDFLRLLGWAARCGWVRRPTPWCLVGDHLDQNGELEGRDGPEPRRRGADLPWASGSAAASSTESNSKIPSDTQPLIVAMVILGVRSVVASPQ